MHLRAAQPGGFTDDEGIIDLEQTPADIVILSAADSSLAGLANSAECLPQNFPSIRLANWMQLLKPAALDLYFDRVLDYARVVVVSFLGGESYWPYGFEQLVAWVNEAKSDYKRTLVLVPGDNSLDDDLFNASSVCREDGIRIWRYLRQGGALNHQQLFYFLATEYLECDYQWHEPEVLPNCMIYMPGETAKHAQASLLEWQTRWLHHSLSHASSGDLTPDVNNVCVILFYRSHLQSANTAMFDALIAIFEKQGLQPLPIAVVSLKDSESLGLVNALLEQVAAKLVINTTSFACNRAKAPDLENDPTHFSSPFRKKIPVLQLVLSSSTEEDWQNYQQGLRSRDIAMQVVLPEMDGRIITRAISFKSEAYYSELCQVAVVRYALHHERAAFIAELAERFCLLSLKPNKEKRLALILANYPTKDGRIGNGVGLDTPESTINILKSLAVAGYPVDAIPEDGTALIKEMLGAVTNNPNTLHQLPCWQSLDVNMYWEYFLQMPQVSQTAVVEQWGTPDQDPKYRNGRLMLAGIRLGETFVGIQPARGFNMDLQANYHDPDLIPPHSYLAFYFWLRHTYQVDAIIHVGKHGNLEWLPGKGTALSETCWPDLALGPVPHFYPFIVNDPGEGAQAKRRTQAVIIDHLMPPMTRAEVYGELAELEALVDEYYQAMGMDTRREQWLCEEIIKKVRHTNIIKELACSKEAKDEDLLNELDAYLCDIKEAQIRHGLHILGELPNKEKLSDTLVALLRLPRGQGENEQGILHCIAQDLLLSDSSSREVFNPLTSTAEAWQGKRPKELVDVCDQVWRTEADTRERLELLAMKWVSRYVLNDAETINTNEILSIDKDFASKYPRTATQLKFAKEQLKLSLEQSAEQELQALINGLNGLFVEPGPSGAPTRGRLDTLPTGRNFFSVDNRSIPSPAAWELGQRSAQALIERHLQEEGDYPKQLGLSVWGTATMRTGGDDIAQAFALMGVAPVWAEGSQRVVDVEVQPTQLMAWPRVDVTLRVSGFFRDAFPNVMKLFDTAVQAIAEFEESGGQNIIRDNILLRTQKLVAEGLTSSEAKRQASYRVFGSKPGAYGAGLQGLIDERCWETQSDLAEAYLNWGGFAYGADKQSQDGVEAKQAFQHQLSHIDVVVQNQDNREHDILDSDDYYQFQGGMTNAVTDYSGRSPTVYHNDHSNPSLPKVRTLKEELNRVVRSRVLNPKWISAMHEHGYKGVFEIAATVDYLFAYDATTNLIDDYQYKDVTDTLVFNEANKAFMQANNPSAYEEMSERLLEAIQRGLWQEPGEYADKLQDLLLDIDASNE